jgi:hypothetical protein
MVTSSVSDALMALIIVSMLANLPVPSRSLELNSRFPRRSGSVLHLFSSVIVYPYFKQIL